MSDALRQAIFDAIGEMNEYAAMDTPQGDLAAASLSTGEVWLIQIHPARLEVNVATSSPRTAPLVP